MVRYFARLASNSVPDPLFITLNAHKILEALLCLNEMAGGEFHACEIIEDIRSALIAPHDFPGPIKVIVSGGFFRVGAVDPSYGETIYTSWQSMDSFFQQVGPGSTQLIQDMLVDPEGCICE